MPWELGLVKYILAIVWLLGDFGQYEIVEPNQQHHSHPWMITRNTYWERSKLSICIAIPVFVLGLITWWPIAVFALFGSQANQIHYYAHLADCKIPAPIRFLQDCYILQSRRHHSRHHAEPFDTRFCVMSPWLNRIIELGFTPGR